MSAAFHVGAHKTGTSTVQMFLRENPRLLHRHHLQFIDREQMNGLVEQGVALVRNPQPLAERMRRVARNPWFDALVLSYEDTLGKPFVPAVGPTLYPSAPRLLDALHDVMAPYPTRIVLSVRPQHQFLESFYLQTIHTGKHHRFAEWLAGIDLDAISWWPLVDAITDRFGARNVTVLDFRLIARDQGEYLRRFFAVLDPTLAFPDVPARPRNPSISGKGLEMALAANRHIRSSDDRRAVRTFLQTHFSNRDYPRPALLTDGQRAWLEQRYDDEYERLVSGPLGAPAPAPTTR